jgi:hypothetical protein
LFGKLTAEENQEARHMKDINFGKKSESVSQAVSQSATKVFLGRPQTTSGPTKIMNSTNS